MTLSLPAHKRPLHNVTPKTIFQVGEKSYCFTQPALDALVAIEEAKREDAAKREYALQKISDPDAEELTFHVLKTQLIYDLEKLPERRYSFKRDGKSNSIIITEITPKRPKFKYPYAQDLELYIPNEGDFTNGGRYTLSNQALFEFFKEYGLVSRKGACIGTHMIGFEQIDQNHRDYLRTAIRNEFQQNPERDVHVKISEHVVLGFDIPVAPRGSREMHGEDFGTTGRRARAESQRFAPERFDYFEVRR